MITAITIHQRRFSVFSAFCSAAFARSPMLLTSSFISFNMSLYASLSSFQFVYAFHFLMTSQNGNWLAISLHFDFCAWKRPDIASQKSFGLDFPERTDRPCEFSPAFPDCYSVFHRVGISSLPPAARRRLTTATWPFELARIFHEGQEERGIGGVGRLGGRS